MTQTGTLQIEVGKYYRTRDGRKVGPMVGRDFKWVDGQGGSTDPEWNRDGTHRSGFTTYADELIAEWTDPPKTWGEMTDAEKGALLLAEFNGVPLEQKGKVIVGGERLFRWAPKQDGCWLGSFAYRIKPEPVVEEVVMTGAVSRNGNFWFDSTGVGISNDTHSITFTTKDGEMATGTFRNEAGDVLKVERIND